MSDKALRQHVAALLGWQDAHASFESAVKGMPAELRGAQPPGLPYSAWQLLEHLRLAQWDILDFCRNPAYQEREFPAGYWPEGSVPPTATAWEESVAGYLRDRAELVKLAHDPDLDLYAQITHGTGQTYLRELLLAADHGAYHVGELVAVRRLLGAWPGR